MLVFISYSSKEEAAAREIESHLKANGYEVWLDKLNLYGGMNYVDGIATALDKADVVVPLLSPSSVRSPWVWREICFAAEKNKRIAPVIIKFTELPRPIAFVLTGVQCVNFKESDEPWGDLLAAMEATGGASTVNYEHIAQRAGGRFRSLRRKWRAFLSSPFIVAAITLVVAWLLLPSLPTPQEIFAPGASPQALHALEVAYTTPAAHGGAVGEPEAAVTAFWRPRSGGEWQTLEGGQELSSADQYVLAVQPRTDAWCYVFQIDAQGQLFPLFPAMEGAPFATGSNPVKAGQWNLIPAADQALYLDETLGMEHVYVVVTAAPWPDIEAALVQPHALPPEPTEAPEIVLAAFSTPGRGVAGKEAATTSALPLPDSKVVQATFTKGFKGALVEEIQFKHVAP